MKELLPLERDARRLGGFGTAGALAVQAPVYLYRNETHHILSMFINRVFTNQFMGYSNSKTLEEADEAFHIRSGYAKACELIVQHCGEKKVREIREVHLQDLLNQLEGFSKSHITKARMIIRALFASVVRNGIIKENHADDLGNPRGTYGGHRTLEKWEIDLVAMHWRVRRAGVWVALMLFSGMRKGEAQARQWKDFDEETMHLRVENTMHTEGDHLVDSGTTKTEAGVREIPVFPPPVVILPEMRGSGGDFMLRKADGGKLTNISYRRALASFLLALEKIANGYDPDKQIREDQKGEAWIKVSFTAHDLRYSFATMLYEVGVDEKTAQKWMGHASADMIRKAYAQLSKTKYGDSTALMKERMAEKYKKDPPPK